MFHPKTALVESHQDSTGIYSGPNLVRELLDSIGIVAGSLLIVTGIFATKGGRNLKLTQN